MTDPRRGALQALVEGQGVTRLFPPALLPAEPFFDLAGEEFGRRLFLTTTNAGHDLCLRPEFTLPIARHYIESGSFGRPAAYTYLGPVFRQGEDGPDEFEQAGLELIAQPDASAALDRVFGFARDTLAVFGVDAPRVRIGGVALFEALLSKTDLPTNWQARFRHHFGNDDAMSRLIRRLSRPLGNTPTPPQDHGILVDQIVRQMADGGLTIGASRMPDEIADRWIEKQSLDTADVSRETLALLTDYLAIAGSPAQSLDRVIDLARAHGIELEQAIANLHAHVKALAALLPRATLTFKAAFSPPLDYYTGIVFEMVGEQGNVLASGGEYDRLLQRLGATAAVAASGCSVWVDRLAEAAP